MICRTAILLLLNASLFAAEFHTGQAARAVLGQSSFTSQERGVNVTSLVVSQGRLYASDASHHTLTFDLSQIPDVRDDFAGRQSSGCGLCGFSPTAVANQSVMPGVAVVSVWDKTVAIADTRNHRVLIWRDASQPRPDSGPDVILGTSGDPSVIGPATLLQPVSVALDGKRLFVGDAALHRVLVWNSLPLSGSQAADVVLGQPDATSVAASPSPTPDTISTPTAMASDGTNLFVADAPNRRILVFSPGDIELAPNAAVNSASLASVPLAPGTLVSVSGRALSESEESVDPASSEPLPKILGGSELIFDGEALPLLAISPNEVQAQIPYDVGNRSAASVYLRTEHPGGAVSVSTPIAVRLVPASPGLFAFSGKEPRGGILLHPAGNTPSGAPVTEESPAKPGEIVAVWATGLGSIGDNNANSSSAPVLVPVTAQVDGQSAQVLSAKLLSGAIGVYEVQLVVPTGLSSQTEAHLKVTQNGLTSNTVTFPLR